MLFWYCIGLLQLPTTSTRRLGLYIYITQLTDNYDNDDNDDAN